MSSYTVESIKFVVFVLLFLTGITCTFFAVREEVWSVEIVLPTFGDFNSCNDAPAKCPLLLQHVGYCSSIVNVWQI